MVHPTILRKKRPLGLPERRKDFIIENVNSSDKKISKEAYARLMETMQGLEADYSKKIREILHEIDEIKLEKLKKEMGFSK